jgi:hypothetical protein
MLIAESLPLVRSGEESLTVLQQDCELNHDAANGSEFQFEGNILIFRPTGHSKFCRSVVQLVVAISAICAHFGFWIRSEVGAEITAALPHT